MTPKVIIYCVSKTLIVALRRVLKQMYYCAWVKNDKLYDFPKLHSEESSVSITSTESTFGGVILEYASVQLWGDTRFLSFYSSYAGRKVDSGQYTIDSFPKLC